MLPVLYTLPRFGEATSISGVNNAAKSKSRSRAFVWTIIFLGLAALTVQGIVAVKDINVSFPVRIIFDQIVVDYWNYPIVTSTDVSYKVIRNQVATDVNYL